MWNPLRSRLLDLDYMSLLFLPVSHVERTSLPQYILTWKLLSMKVLELVSIYLAPLEQERQLQFEKSLHS
jgi:hypothetical protein